MPNKNLQNQCKVMQSSIELFKSAAKQACLDDDDVISNAESKYIKKLNKKLDSLTAFLQKSP